MKILSAVLIILALIVGVRGQIRSTEDLGAAGFKSDGCTWWPDGDYTDCCVEHDKAYFKGGSRKDRRLADDRLYRCVLSKNTAGKRRDARLMWLGVRIGGVGWLPTPFRWGFGRGFWESNGRWLRGADSGLAKRDR